MYDLEVPFNRLVYHFVKRIFYGAGEGDELQFGIPALLGLLSTPAAFGSISLLNKYSTLLLYLHGRRFFDVYRASVPDEYFFISYSMVITGAVVVLKWDRLFPDRQDFDNLAVLPLSMRQIFAASLAALLFLAALFAVDINWAACFVFPYAVTSRYDTFAAYGEFFVAHTSAVVLSSLFACFGLLSILGLTLLIAPRRYMRTASMIVRICCSLGLVAILGSAFGVPRMLLSTRPPAWTSYVPPVWFLDLHQYVIGRGAPFSGSAAFAAEMTILAFIAAMAAYALTYFRQFSRIPEQTAVQPRARKDGASIVRRLVDTAVVRTPFQRAAYHFTLKTLLRSDRHCLLLGTAIGIGLFAAAQTLAEVMAEAAPHGLDSRLLSVPLTLSYFIICSLRVLYDLPAERNANWIFRTTVDELKHESRPAGVKVMLTLIVPWLVVVAIPLYAARWGWTIALLHAAYVLVWSAVLAELLLAGFRKIPFTCLHVGSKDRVLVMIIFFLIGFSLFSSANSVVETGFLQTPLRFVLLPIFLVAFVLAIRVRERGLPFKERILIFEDRPAAPIQVLDLS